MHVQDVVGPACARGVADAGEVGVREVTKSIGGHRSHKFEISVTDWAPELTTSEAISPPRLPVTTDGPTAEMRPKLEVTETRLRERKARSLAKAKLACEASLLSEIR